MASPQAFLIATGVTVTGIAGISGIVDIQFPGYTVKDIDVSDQTSSGFRDYVPSLLKDCTDLNITGKFTGAYPTAGTLFSGASLVVPGADGFSGATINCNGYIKGFTPAKSNLDGVVMYDAAVKITRISGI